MGRPLTADVRVDEDLGRLIALARRLVWTAAARRLEARGESMLFWQVANRLNICGPSTQCDLAWALGQHPAGASRLLDQLEREGMVQRTRVPEDRRKVRVELTIAGRQRFESLRPEIAEASAEVLAPLSPAERRSLRSLLSKLVDAHP